MHYLSLLLVGLALAEVQGEGLRYNNGGVWEVNDPMERVYDGESNRQYELDMYPNDEIRDNFNSSSIYVPSFKHLRRSLAIDPLSPIAQGKSLSSMRMSVSCHSNQRAVTITIKTDEQGHETSWELRKKYGSEAMYDGPDESVDYVDSTTYSGVVCLNVGMYVFTIFDDLKDGMCCSAGNGHYDIEVQNKDGSWRDAVRGKQFYGKKMHTIDVGKMESTMTDRDKEYLIAHNKRRLQWHTEYGKAYVPLKWSKGLRDLSEKYAVKLLDTCLTDTPRHDTNNPYGENLARNKGGGDWGQLYDPEQIVGRFVEHEIGLPWARNGHMTNVLWRATTYVGCAEASKSYQVASGSTHNCRAQVCRYAKPGNCGMGLYKRSNGLVDWEKPVMADDSPCGPDHPPEGAYD